MRQESTTILQSGTPKIRYKIRCLPEILIYFVKPLLLTYFAVRPLFPLCFGDSMLFLCLESKKHPDAMYYI